MRAIQDHPGHYFHTDDGLCLRFNEAHGDAPYRVNAAIIGRGGIERPSTMPIMLATCDVMAGAFFGDARPSGHGTTKWTGDSHRFGFYSVSGDVTKGVLIFRTDGTGARFYFIDERDAIQTWGIAYANLATEVLWNLCMTITETYEQARRDERREQHALFAAGRLKKRRKGGAIYVDVLPAA